MNEGEILLDFIDRQKRHKSAIAEDLKISRRTLYQYFDSTVLTPTIKERFEKYFGVKIFSGAAVQPVAQMERKQKIDPWQVISDLVKNNTILSEATMIMAKKIEGLPLQPLVVSSDKPAQENQEQGRLNGPGALSEEVLLGRKKKAVKGT